MQGIYEWVHHRRMEGSNQAGVVFFFCSPRDRFRSLNPRNINGFLQLLPLVLATTVPGDEIGESGGKEKEEFITRSSIYIHILSDKRRGQAF